MRCYQVKVTAGKRSGAQRATVFGDMVSPLSLASGKSLREFCDMKTHRWEGKVMNGHEVHLNRLFLGK
jgi:hypothetical protein